MNSTNSTVAMVIWNDATATQVRNLVEGGKSVPAALVQLAPKGFVSGLRKARSSTLRSNSQVIMAQLEKEGYRIEKLPALFDTDTKTFTGGKVNRNGDVSIEVKLVKKAKTEVTKEDALAALGLSAADLAVVEAMRQKPAGEVLEIAGTVKK